MRSGINLDKTPDISADETSRDARGSSVPHREWPVVRSGDELVQLEKNISI